MALWLKLKDSMTHIGILNTLTFLVLMQYLSLCHSLPIGKETVNENSWRCEPRKELHHKTRHSRHIRSLLKDQLNTTIQYYDSFTQLYMDEILLKISNKTKNQLRRSGYKWLPRTTFFQKLKKGDLTILPELYENIQLYAATFQRLMDMEIHTQDVWIPLKFRLGNFTLVKKYLNSLRCEVEDEIFEQGLEADLVKLQKKDLDKQINLPLSVGNLIDGLLKDYIVLRDYGNFLKTCRGKMFGKHLEPRKNQRGKNKKNRKIKNKYAKNKKVMQS